MVLDSSAIVAIHLQETGHERLTEAIERAEVVAVGVPTLLETTLLLSSRLGQDPRALLLSFVRRIEAEVVPFNEEHLQAATSAFFRFGRGRHPAALNFGDCMAYAIASVAGMPLLFTGNDFAQTDIDRA